MTGPDLPLTRRSLLALGLAAAGTRALEPLATAAAAIRPSAASFSVALPYARRIGPVAIPQGLDLAGLTWAGRVHPAAEIRARTRNGWTAWLPLAHAHDHGPDGAPRDGATDPVWFGRAHAVELRLSRPLYGLTLRAVRASAPAPRIHAGTAQAGGPPVAIITRSQWGGDQVPPRAAPEYGVVRLAFVHHTVNDNNYSPQDSPSIVLAIAQYHRNHNGWNDIGYNFLVDKYGQVFEGRAGGIDQAIVGAQAQGYNSWSTGVANIGTFQTVAQTPQAIDALAKLIAWKLAVHGAPVQGQVTVSSNGGESNRYPAGQAVVLNRISGHRDGDSTDCPGDALYAQLPDLRNRAAAEQDALGGPRPAATHPGLTLVASTARVALPAGAEVSGTLQGADGSPVGGVPVALQIAGPSGAWVTVAKATTGADGAYVATVPVRRNTSVRARYAPSRYAKPALSPPLPVTVVPALKAAAGARRIPAGRAVRVDVATTPRRPRVVLVLARQLPSGRFAPVGAVRARVRGSKASALVTLKRPGLYRIIAQAPADKSAAAAVAPWVFVRALRTG